MTTWTTTVEWPTSLLRVGDLTAPGLEELLGLAATMKAQPDRWTQALQGTSLTCLFETPTTRAGLSTEAAAHRLGMEPIRVHPHELRFGRGEPIEDTARIMSRYTAAIVVRDLPERMLAQVARAADAPVVNAQSPGHHPCQAVADLLTLRERFDALRGLVLAYVGASNNVAVSLMQAGAMTGMEVRVACPEEHRPDREEQTAAEVLADLHGGAVNVGADPVEAATDADALYTAAWPHPDDEAERLRIRQRLKRYQVDTDLMAHAKPGAVFLHCLPAYRGEEVTPGIIDWPRRSLVWEQAANRLPAEQAIIYALATARRDRAGAMRRA
jgi:ornithine carbamoyltransferase